MRFIGSKERLLDFIYSVAVKNKINNGVVCDIFAGTGAVGKLFKQKGFDIISNDNLFFSYVLQHVYIQMNDYPDFHLLHPKGNSNYEKCHNIIQYLNSLEGIKDFTYHEYSPGGKSGRMYFTEKNAGSIDAIRLKIENWKREGIINLDEYLFLVCSLVEAVPFISNITGVYGAFLKSWDRRALKDIKLHVPIITVSSNNNCLSYNEDANQLIKNISCNMLYLDPPYNERQYITNYHILETIARWDYPEVYGKTGLRPYNGQKSEYCYRDKAIKAFEELVKSADTNHIILSYNAEGIMPKKDIMDILLSIGNVKVYSLDYRRYRSDSDSEKRRYKVPNNDIKEIIYYCQVDRRDNDE